MHSVWYTYNLRIHPTAYGNDAEYACCPVDSGHALLFALAKQKCTIRSDLFCLSLTGKKMNFVEQMNDYPKQLSHILLENKMCLLCMRSGPSLLIYIFVFDTRHFEKYDNTTILQTSIHLLLYHSVFSKVFSFSSKKSETLSNNQDSVCELEGALTPLPIRLYC